MDKWCSWEQLHDSLPDWLWSCSRTFTTPVQTKKNPFCIRRQLLQRRPMGEHLTQFDCRTKKALKHCWTISCFLNPFFCFCFFFEAHTQSVIRHCCTTEQKKPYTTTNKSSDLLSKFSPVSILIYGFTHFCRDTHSTEAYVVFFFLVSVRAFR